MARTFIFQRPADGVDVGDGWYRVLTPKGLGQAASVQQKLKERSLAPADVRFSSPDLQAIQTITLDGRDCHLLDALGMPRDGSDWKEFGQLSTGLLFVHPRVWLERMEPLIKRLTVRAAERMTPLLPSHGIIRVVGHETFLHFLASHFLGERGHPADRQLILGTLLEGGACIILCHDGKVEILEP